MYYCKKFCIIILLRNSIKNKLKEAKKPKEKKNTKETHLEKINKCY